MSAPAPQHPSAAPLPRRALGPRAALATGGLLLGLGLAEGLARLWRPPAGSDLLLSTASFGTPEDLYRRHPRLQLEPTPGFAGEVVSVGQRIPVHINSLGCRGPEPAPQGPRWAAVGDSFTIALQVRQEQSFTQLAGQQLGLELLNGGVDGYSTWQAAERYRLLDDAADLSGVLLTFFLGNDISDNARIAAERRQAGGEPPPPPSPPIGGAARAWLATHSLLYSYGSTSLRRLRVGDPTHPDHLRLRGELLPFSAAGAEALRSQLGDTRMALTQLRDEAGRRGDRLVVALAPPLYAADPGRAEATLAMVGLDTPRIDAPRDALLSVLAELGIQACDLSPALRDSYTAGRQPYLLLDGHWSVEGHRAVAETLSPCLRAALEE
jgi:hypothetical protein